MSKVPKYRHKVTGMIAVKYTDEFYLVRTPRTFLRTREVEDDEQWEKVLPETNKKKGPSIEQ